MGRLPIRGRKGIRQVWQPFKKNKVSVIGHSSALFCLPHKLLPPFVSSLSPSWLSLGRMSWRVKTTMRSFWKQLVLRFFFFLIDTWVINGKMWVVIGLNFVECHLLCHRASQCQDRPQSGNRGGSGWEQFHLDTNHSQLDLVQWVQHRSGMWAGDYDGLQIQGELITGTGEIILRQQICHIFTTCHEASM